MREAAGIEAAPGFDGLSAQLTRITQVLRAQIARRRQGLPRQMPSRTVRRRQFRRILVGTVKSRQDAIRALDAVAEFFRRTEPSSPIPMFLERAKRWCPRIFSKCSPTSRRRRFAQARAAGGLKDP